MGSTGDINTSQGPSTGFPAPSPPSDDAEDDIPPAYEELPSYTSTAPGSCSASAALAAAKETEKKKNKKVPVEDITSAFSSLHLTDEPLNLPNTETCLAHLKLLYAFRELREGVGYSNGLWGIADPEEDSKAPEVPLSIMSRLREKRWAVYLARAVDRYEAWWASLGGKAVTLSDMQLRGSVTYEMFPLENVGVSMIREESLLMPLDVLMVWHTHMLNPRAYLEDCIRSGHRALWHRGFPWRTVNSAINTSFEYKISEDAKHRWESKTGLPWENSAYSMTKVVTCPVCSTEVDVPWTTWNSNTLRPTDDDFVGHGYGDGDFSAVCAAEACSYVIDKETLYAAKFGNDVKNLLKGDVPMPGTVLNLETGMPSIGETALGDHTFPNQLIRRQMPETFLKIFKSKRPVTMETVKDAITAAVEDLQPLSDLDAVGKGKGERLFLRRHSKMATRKMLSRYVGNHSALALDLVAAVSRQSVFIDKMYKLDWLHSPSAKSTMARLITKYTRFIDIMARFPTEMAVPTLDVDLAWHTAQLTPATYFLYTTGRCKKFVNHDDKVADIALRDAFEKTSKKYQKLYSEVYSECTCWYCETVRAGHASAFGGSLGLSSQDKVTDAFHSSGAAESCPPDNSAHVSAHSSVRVPNTGRAQAWRQARQEFEFERAQKRAGKKGRKVELTKQYYEHWGKMYAMFAPWGASQHFCPALYDDGCPGTVERSACAEKTCAGGLGNGVCGGPGGCGDCGTDGGPAFSARCGGGGGGAVGGGGCAAGCGGG